MTAAEFYQELHDVFTRSFVENSVCWENTGIVLPRTDAAPGLGHWCRGGRFHCGDIEKATRFLSSRGLQDAGAVQMVMEAQDRFLRLAAAEAISRRPGN